MGWTSGVVDELVEMEAVRLRLGSGFGSGVVVDVDVLIGFSVWGLVW